MIDCAGLAAAGAFGRAPVMGGGMGGGALGLGMPAPGSGEPKLFVGNLPGNASEDDLRMLFSTYGQVEEVGLGLAAAWRAARRGAAVHPFGQHGGSSARSAPECGCQGTPLVRCRCNAMKAVGSEFVVPSYH